MILTAALRPYVVCGALNIINARGEKTTLQGSEPGPDVTIRIHDFTTHWRIILNPTVAIGEAYMDGRLTVESGDIYHLLELYFRGIGAKMRAEPANQTHCRFLRRQFLRMLRHIRQFNPPSRSRENVQHHYDIGEDLYRLFLDRDMQYSCAYFEHEADDLETAQAQKKRHIAAKLLLQPEHEVLDIGCGWGGMALYLAQETGARVKGITLSDDQLAVATRRQQASRIGQHVQFALQDYRAEGQNGSLYDRIVSVGMFEHVGVRHYDEFFSHARHLLKDDGVMLLHSIGRMDGPGITSPWMTKYIFPGGYAPALSEVTAAIERQNLFITDIEVWRLHYARTLQIWRERFHQNWDKAKALYDERFCRMWDFYLAACRASFEFDDSIVFQIQITKQRDAVPLTRDYITEWKNQHPLKRPTSERRLEVVA